jgi:hypothetical protein
MERWRFLSLPTDWFSALLLRAAGTLKLFRLTRPKRNNSNFSPSKRA